MAAHKLRETGAAEIRKVIDAVTADPHTQLPGFVFSAVNHDGEELISYAAGKIGVDTSEPMTLETVFWIASCTKLITAIACMQLVEQGKLHLDDADQMEKLCPELKQTKILRGFDENRRPILEPKKTGITLRMLLSHQAGFGYTFFNSEIRQFGYPIGIDEFSGRVEDLYAQPLLFEPGTNVDYGTNIDWAGIIVEKATGLSLEGYFQKFIFAPLNMKNTTFFPTKEQKSRLVHMSQRAPDGTVTGREHVFRLPLAVSSEEQENIFNSGGGGCYGEPKEFTSIISMLLNNGTSPITGAQLLRPETVDQMFTNQIPQWPNFGRTPIITGRPEYANSIAELYPQPHDQPHGFGLTIFLTIEDGATGRGKNTGFWGGLPNLFWWVDRERGVGGIVAGQLVPFGDAHVIATWAKVETLLYQG